MNILKKIVGIILMLFSALFFISALITFLKFIFQANTNADAYNIGYIIGHIIGFIAFVIISYLILKFGLKLVKKKVEEIKADSIDEIGLH